MKFARQAPPLLVLQSQQAAGERAQRLSRFLAFGDVTIYGASGNLSTRHGYRHADDKNGQATAILPPANGFCVHSLTLRYQFHKALKFIAQIAGYDEIAQEAAHSFLRCIPKNPCELPVNPDHLVSATH